MTNAAKTSMWISPHPPGANIPAITRASVDFSAAAIKPADARDPYPADSVHIGSLIYPAMMRFHPVKAIPTAAPPKWRGDIPVPDGVNLEIWDRVGCVLARAALLDRPLHDYIIFLRQPDGAELCGGFSLTAMAPLEIKGEIYWSIEFEDIAAAPAKWIAPRRSEDVSNA